MEQLVIYVKKKKRLAQGSFCSEENIDIKKKVKNPIFFLQ
jgi:hypothetical protein